MKRLLKAMGVAITFIATFIAMIAVAAVIIVAIVWLLIIAVR